MRYGYMLNNHRVRARREREVRKLFLEGCGIILFVFILVFAK